MHGNREPVHLPARLARTSTAVWIVDAAAGADLA
jgi:hypothetical protein